MQHLRSCAESVCSSGQGAALAWGGDVPGHATQAMLPAGVIVVATRSHGPTYIEGLHKHTPCSSLQSFMEIVGAHFLRSICSTWKCESVFSWIWILEY